MAADSRIQLRTACLIVMQTRRLNPRVLPFLDTWYCRFGHILDLSTLHALISRMPDFFSCCTCYSMLSWHNAASGQSLQRHCPYCC